MKFPVIGNVPVELSAIRVWLETFKQAMMIAFLTSDNMEVVYIVPAKPVIGMTVYFGLGTPAPITHEGLWVYTSTGWKACNS